MLSPTPVTIGTQELRGENRTVGESGKWGGNTFGQTRHKETEHLCYHTGSLEATVSSAWRSGCIYSVKEKDLLGRMPKTEHFWQFQQSNSQGHMVLTLSFLWTTFWVAMHNPNFYHLRPQILERLLGFSSAPRSFSSINNCVRGYNSLLHLSCHRTLLKLESCSF